MNGCLHQAKLLLDLAQIICTATVLKHPKTVSNKKYNYLILKIKNNLY